MSEHRWSGWPGAYCLDCGAEDPSEIALADGDYEEVYKEDKLNGFVFHFDPSLLICKVAESLMTQLMNVESYDDYFDETS